MEITQEERLDLKREQVKEEMQAYNSKFSDWCQVFGLDQKKLMEEYYHDIAINSNEYKKLKEENQRLKKQLNKEIHYNRKMKRVLEVYANTEPIEIMQQRWNGEPTTIGKTMLDIRKLAQQVLKEIDNKE